MPHADRGQRGPVAATATSATLSLSGASHTILSATPSQGSCTVGASVNCSLGTITAEGTATVTVRVEPNAAGTIAATATVSAAEPDPTVGNNTAKGTTTVDNANGCTIMGTPGNDTIAGTSGSGPARPFIGWLQLLAILAKVFQPDGSEGPPAVLKPLAERRSADPAGT